MTYKCDIKFMAVPSRMQNVVTLCNQLGLSYQDVAVDHEMRGKPLLTSQKAFLLPHEDGVTHRLVLQDDLVLNPYIKNNIQHLVNRFPENPIALYTYKHKKPLTDGIYKMHFCPGPAIIMPLAIMEQITMEYQKYPQFPHDDWFYSWFCARNSVKALGIIPNLVTLDLRFESTHGQVVLKRYVNDYYTERNVDISLLADKTNEYGDKYLNLSDTEFNKILDDYS